MLLLQGCVPVQHNGKRRGALTSRDLLDEKTLTAGRDIIRIGVVGRHGGRDQSQRFVELELAQRVLGIPFKLARQRAIDHLEYEEIDAILKTINRNTMQGSRDYALLATMFHTGGRVQEIADWRACDLQLTKP